LDEGIEEDVDDVKRRKVYIAKNISWLVWLRCCSGRANDSVC
jgi:hypothetical protein